MFFKRFFWISLITIVFIAYLSYFFLLNQRINVLAALLQTYEAHDQNGAIELTRQGKNNDGGYVVARKALTAADALLGYGIAEDNSFEEQFSAIYKKPSYGFDCGIQEIKSQTKLFSFINECIATEDDVYHPENSSHKISNFSQQIKNLYLEDKKLFIKMDIEGSEYQAFKQILPYSEIITGIVLELHMRNIDDIDHAITLLSNLEKNFILLHVHGNNCNGKSLKLPFTNKRIPLVMELTFINISQVKTYSAEKNQHHPRSLDMKNCPSRKDMEFDLSVKNNFAF